MRISDWSSDVCSSDLNIRKARVISSAKKPTGKPLSSVVLETIDRMRRDSRFTPMRVSIFRFDAGMFVRSCLPEILLGRVAAIDQDGLAGHPPAVRDHEADIRHRSEEHTSELQSLMRISYAV